MYLVFFEPKDKELTPERCQVTCIHHNPSILDEEVKTMGIVIDNLPQPLEPKFGKGQSLYINTLNGEIWSEYFDRELTQEERMFQLQSENTELKQQLAQTNTDMQGLMDYLAVQGVI